MFDLHQTGYEEWTEQIAEENQTAFIWREAVKKQREHTKPVDPTSKGDGLSVASSGSGGDASSSSHLPGAASSHRRRLDDVVLDSIRESLPVQPGCYPWSSATRVRCFYSVGSTRHTKSAAFNKSSPGEASRIVVKWAWEMHTIYTGAVNPYAEDASS